MKKKKIFVNKITKKIGNNQTSFNIDEEILESEIPTINDSNDKTSILNKISDLLNRNGYIFNVPVHIVLEDKTYDTFLAGKVNNHLITLDNDIINIDDIKELIIKK